MSDSAAVEPSSARDELLAQLLADLIEQQRRGEKADIETIARQHPELTAELRELWAAAQVAEELGTPAAGSHATLDLLPRPRIPGAAPFSTPRIVGDYELIEELGRGGMGVVFKARQRSLNRTVALKMILRGDLASAAELARFR